MASLNGRALAVLLFLFFTGITSFIKGLGWLKEKRLIEDIPTSEIRSIAMGLVEIYGQVIAIKSKVLKSPLSNNDCVYYSFKIEELRREGKSSRWVTIKSGTAENNFLVKDQT